MAPELSTTLTELEDSRVRVEVEVPSEAVERQVDIAARSLAEEMKVPGFRKGQAPAPVVVQRLGRATVVEHALRGALREWYEEAVGHARLASVGRPDLALTAMPEKGAPLTFSFEVGVVPTAVLGAHRGLEVPRGSTDVDREQVDAEVERLRDSLASLEPAGRPARDGDFVMLEFTGTIDGEPFDGGEAHGTMLELGSGRLGLPGFEEQLVGAAAAEDREVRVSFPDDYDAAHLRGREAIFEVTVSQVQEKRLPDVDGDFAAAVGGFESVDKLRSDAESKLREAREGAVEAEFRGAAVDAAVSEATIDLPRELVHERAHDMWRAATRELREQGIDAERYLEATGKSEEDAVTAYEPEAEQALRRESVLAAVVEAEGIEASDGEVLDSMRELAAAHSATHEHDPPGEDDLRGSLEQAKAEGRDGQLRADVCMGKAVDLLVEHAVPVPAERADPG